MNRIIKLFACLLIFTVAISFSACNASKGGTGEKTKYSDEAFLKDLKKGLQARWDIVDQEADEKEYINNLNLGINAELEVISKYSNEIFEDNKLKEKAITYINLLNDQLNALNYVYNDITKYDEMWTKAYNERSKLINGFITDYNLSFDEKYKDDVDQLLNNSKGVLEKEETDKKFKEMIDKIEFKVSDNAGEWKTYSGIVENTTGIDYKYVDFNINLFDKDGVIISSEFDNVNNFTKGKKAKIEFSTDKEFASTEVTANYYN